MKQFEMPVIQVELFSVENVVTTSVIVPGENETPMPDRGY